MLDEVSSHTEEVNLSRNYEQLLGTQCGRQAMASKKEADTLIQAQINEFC